VRFGHDVLVLDRNHGHINPDHLAGLACKIAGGRDDVFAHHIALSVLTTHSPPRRCSMPVTTVLR